MMKPKTGGQNNHIGTTAKEGQCYKNMANQYEECEFCFLTFRRLMSTTVDVPHR